MPRAGARSCQRDILGPDAVLGVGGTQGDLLQQLGTYQSVLSLLYNNNIVAVVICSYGFAHEVHQVFPEFWVGVGEDVHHQRAVFCLEPRTWRRPALGLRDHVLV
jgi:hypothetical protein